MNERLFPILGMVIAGVGLFMLIINYFINIIPENVHYWVVWLSAFSAVVFTFRLESDDLKVAKLYAHRISGYIIIASLLALAGTQGIEGTPAISPSWYLLVFIWIAIWYATYSLFLLGVVKEEDESSESENKRDIQKILSGFIVIGSIAVIVIMAEI